MTVIDERSSIPQTDGEGPYAPIIGADTVFRDEGVTVTVNAEDTANDGHKENAYAEGFTHDFWMPGVSGFQWIRASLIAPRAVTYAAIAAHDLHTQGAVLRVQHSTDGGDSWRNAVRAFTPGSNGPILLLFDEVEARDWRLRVDNADASISLGVVHIGKALILDNEIQGGFRVPALARQNRYVNEVSEGGQFIGRSLIAEGAELSLDLPGVRMSWLREHWEPAVRKLESYPFFFSQCDRGDWRDEVFYGWATEQPRSEYANNVYGRLVLAARGITATPESVLLDMPLRSDLTMRKGRGTAAFSRSSTATYVDLAGVVQTASVDEPRFEAEGYLSERSSTNECVESEDITGTNWGSFQATLTANDTDAPDGNATADKFARDGSSGAHTLNWPEATVSDGALVAVSVFLKAAERDAETLSIYGAGQATFYGTVSWDLSAETASFTTGPSNGATSPLAPFLRAIGNGWYRLVVVVDLPAGETGCRPRLTVADTGSSGDGYYVWGAQIEQGLPYATSYIPTTSSSETRAADSLDLTANGNVVIQAEPGTIIADVTLLGGSNGTSVQDAVAVEGETNREIRANSNLAERPISAWGDVFSPAGEAVSPQQVSRMGVVFDGTDIHFYQDGVLQGSNTPTQFDAIGSAINIGHKANSSHLDGNVRNVRSYNRALTDAEMEADAA